MTFKLDSDLSAVNSILGAIGQAPVTKLEYDNPEISLVYNLLQECTVDVQTEGWQFNTEYARYFPLNSSNEIPSLKVHSVLHYHKNVSSSIIASM